MKFNLYEGFLKFGYIDLHGVHTIFVYVCKTEYIMVLHDWELCAIYNAISSAFGWTSMGLGTSAISSFEWVYIGIYKNEGLWKSCVGSSCTHITGILIE